MNSRVTHIRDRGPVLVDKGYFAGLGVVSKVLKINILSSI